MSSNDRMKRIPDKSPTVGREPSYLVFGAHPDDIEFGCGAVVAKETQAGRVAHFVVGSRGEAGTTNGPPVPRLST